MDLEKILIYAVIVVFLILYFIITPYTSIVFASTVYYGNVSEPFTLTETAEKQSSIFRTLFESFSLTQVYQRTQNIIKTTTESLSIVEITERIKTTIRILSQILSFFFDIFRVKSTHPKWVEGSNSTNSTKAGSDVEFRLQWTDDNDLDGFILSIDPLENDKIIDTYNPRTIKIISQDYISKYIDWSFEEIKSDYWKVNWSIDSNLRTDIEKCLTVAISSNSSCIQNINDEYFLLERKTNEKIYNDLKKINQYPLVSLTSGIDVDLKDLNLLNENGHFYLTFPYGFRENEQVKFGFDSTIINSSNVVAFYPNFRSICKTIDGRLHIVYSKSESAVNYANSTDNGTTWISTTLFSNLVSKPHISCDGNNITVSYECLSAQLCINISEDSGKTWTGQTPRTSNVDWYSGVERRGQNIYIIYRNTTVNSLRFFNSTDAGSTWSSDVTIFDDSADLFNTITVNGTGGNNDKIYVGIVNTTGGNSVYFVNSTDSGNIWGTPIEIGGADNLPSITFSGGNLYLIGRNWTNHSIYFSNSSDGANWETPYRLEDLASGEWVREPSLTIDNNNYPRVFWCQNDTNLNMDLAYLSYNGTDWNDSSINLTNDNLGNRYPNTPYKYYDDDRIHYIWINGTTSPYNILYNYIAVAKMWTNETWTTFPIGGISDWSNYTINITDTVGATIKWKYYANNTANLWNVSNDFSFVTTAPEQIYYGNITESFILNQAIERVQILIKMTSESFTINQAYQRIQNLLKTITCSFDISEAIKRIGIILKMSSESLNINEASSRLTNVFRKLSESFQLIQISNRISLSFQKLSQSFVITDTTQRFFIVVREVSNSFQLSFVTDRLAMILRDLSDSFILNNVMDRIVKFFKIPTDNPTLNNIIDTILIAFKIPSESPTINNIANRIQTLYRIPSSTFTFQSVSERISKSFKNLAQTLTFSLTSKEKYGYLRRLPNIITLSNVGNRISTLFKIPSETLTINNVADRIATFYKIISDFFTFSFSIFEESFYIAGAKCPVPDSLDPSNEQQGCTWDYHYCEWVCMPISKPTLTLLDHLEKLLGTDIDRTIRDIGEIRIDKTIKFFGEEYLIFIVVVSSFSVFLIYVIHKDQKKRKERLKKMSETYEK